MLVRFAYLAVTHAFAALQLLPLTDREKDVEVLAIRHQLTVLQQGEVVLARDFIEAVTLTGACQYILAAVHQAGRRVRILGTTAHMHTVTQAVRNLLMDLETPTALHESGSSPVIVMVSIPR